MISDINGLQTSIMLFIKEWVNTKNTPIPRKEIIKHFESKKVRYYTTEKAIYSLLDKGYIRHGYSGKASTTIYVMCGNI